MILTLAEPIINHLGPVDGVFSQDYPIAYAHLLLSCCFELEPSTLFLYYNRETTKIYCQFCFEKLDQDIQIIMNLLRHGIPSVNWNAYT